MPRLVLFDLDHTLIPFDSGLAWSRWLIAQGHLEASFETRYLAMCDQYVAGTVDMTAMVRMGLQVLARHQPAQLEAWQHAHRQAQARHIPAGAHALVRQHQDAGDLCCLATATVRFIAQPYADLLAFEHFVATEAAFNTEGHFTGDLIGPPNWGHFKHASVQRWLQARGLDDAALREARFYSDSYNDLPLLQAVGDPVVVSPDDRLRAYATSAGWPVIETL